MSLLEWREEYQIGLPGVDHEHRELIATINDLHGALHGPEPVTVADFLGELDAQIAAHFALEEHEMRELRYPGYESHKADHERLLDEIGAMLERQSSGAGFDERELATLLGEWFGLHFRTHDAALHKAVSRGS